MQTEKTLFPEQILPLPTSVVECIEEDPKSSHLLFPPSFVALHKGPTENSNWLIPQQVLMSAYPGHKNLETMQNRITTLVQHVQSFICLQEVLELQDVFVPYMPVVEKICNAQQLPIPKYELFPIPDNDVVSDVAVDEFTNVLVQRIKNGERLLIHCRGGKGRTRFVY